MVYFVAKDAKLESGFGSKKIETDFINKFINQKIRLVDLRSENREIKEEYSDFHFDFKNKELRAKKPETSEEIINTIHAISLFYELSLPLILQDGFVEKGKVFKSNGEKQNLLDFKLSFQDVGENIEDILFLDHPRRINKIFAECDDWKECIFNITKGVMKSNDIYELEAFCDNFQDSEGRFLEFNQGTDFIIYNHKCDKLEDFLGNYMAGLETKTANLIAMMQGPEVKESRDFNFYDLSSRDCIKLIKKVKKIWGGYDISWFVDNLFLKKDEISLEELEKVAMKQIEGSEDESAIKKKKKVLKNLLEDKMSDENLAGIISFGSLDSQEVRCCFSELIDLLKVDEYNSFAVNSFSNALEIEVNSDNVFSPTYMLNNLGFKSDKIVEILGDELIQREVDDAIDTIEEFSDESSFGFNKMQNEMRFLNKVSRRIDCEESIENNKRISSKRFDFKASDVISNFVNQSFFVVPTTIYFFKSKFYDRFSQEMDKCSVPLYLNDNFAFLYDTRRSDFPIFEKFNPVPEKVRNEFLINAYTGGRNVIGFHYNWLRPQKVDYNKESSRKEKLSNGAHLSKKYFAKLSFKD